MCSDDFAFIWLCFVVLGLLLWFRLLCFCWVGASFAWLGVVCLVVTVEFVLACSL